MKTNINLSRVSGQFTFGANSLADETITVALASAGIVVNKDTKQNAQLRKLRVPFFQLHKAVADGLQQSAIKEQCTKLIETIQPYKTIIKNCSFGVLFHETVKSKDTVTQRQNLLHVVPLVTVVPFDETDYKGNKTEREKQYNADVEALEHTLAKTVAKLKIYSVDAAHLWSTCAPIFSEKAQNYAAQICVIANDTAAAAAAKNEKPKFIAATSQNIGFSDLFIRCRQFASQNSDSTEKIHYLRIGGKVDAAKTTEDKKPAAQPTVKLRATEANNIAKIAKKTKTVETVETV